MPQISGVTGSSSHLAEAPPPGLQCTCRLGGSDSVWVRAAGELDLSTSPLLELTVRGAEHQARLVVLDLRELTFMDCAGLHVIVDASVRIKQARRRLVLVRGPSQVDRLFAVTGAADVLEIGDLGPVEYAQVHARLPREAHAA